MGFCFVKGQIFHLQNSLEKIGFIKTQAGLSLTYDAEKDFPYVAHNLEILCQLRGWDYELDVRNPHEAHCLSLPACRSSRFNPAISTPHISRSKSVPMLLPYFCCLCSRYDRCDCRCMEKH